MIVFDQETRQFSIVETREYEVKSFSTTRRGAGRAFIIGGTRSVIGTYGAGKFYDEYRKKGLSEKEAKKKAIAKAGGLVAVSNAIGNAVGVGLVAHKASKKNRSAIIQLGLKESLKDTAKVTAGTIVGANKRINTKIVKDVLNK